MIFQGKSTELEMDEELRLKKNRGWTRVEMGDGLFVEEGGDETGIP